MACPGVVSGHSDLENQIGVKKRYFGNFSEGWDGSALLVHPSRIPCWILKIIFSFGSYEFLQMLEGKTSKGLFNLVK